MHRSAPGTPWLPLLAIAALGFTLRVMAAHGGLWLDEAWSAAFAADVGTPVGVFLKIHHDNNHHLNTLWLQLVGIDAGSLLQRALSIASGTAAILVAGLIAGRHNRLAGIAAATLFAASPIMVTYGSEARGYAPMLLAFLSMIYLVGRWLDQPTKPAPAIGLAVLCLLGTLAQMTFVFGLSATGLWIVARRWRSSGLSRAIIDAARLLALPGMVTVLSVLAITRWLPGPGGFRIGSLSPFTFADLATGQSEMLTFTLGLPPLPVWFVVATAILLLGIVAHACHTERRDLYLWAIVGVPVGCALVQLGNVAIARYFLIGSACLLLLLAEAFAKACSRTVLWRAAGAIAFGAILIGSGWRDGQMIRDRRADPSRAIAAMQARSPGGGTVTLDRSRAAPVLRVAAGQAGYAVRIAPCGRFLFVDRDGAEPFPQVPRQCDASYRPIASAHPSGLSGTHWTLYERRPYMR